MKINNNISAVITNQQLLRTESNLAASMERLSSGFKINHSKDDPSGLAISNKMKAQIDGLSQASQNASDGSSVLETADGALNEVHSMLQRMRELAVQAANDTNSQTDKESIQSEIENLKSEIDRISSTTEFNTKTLLDGSVGARCYADHVSRIQTTEAVKAGPYEFTVNQAATQASMPDHMDAKTAWPEPIGANGIVDINGAKAEISKDMSREEVYKALREAAEMGEAMLSEDGTTISSTAYGADANLKVTVSDPALASALGIPVEQSGVGTDAEITMNKTAPASQFSNTSTYTMDGNRVTFTDVGGFKMSMLLEAGFKTDPNYIADENDPNYDPTLESGKINLEVTDIGPMELQIGSNEGQQMTVIINPTDTKNLYIDDMDVTTVNGASRAIAQADSAIGYINEVRSSLGAYTNRLDYAVKSLDQTNENMNSAISRLKDVDMALEMTDYTKYNVLTQAATSALSQANELPQMALQLLG